MEKRQEIKLIVESWARRWNLVLSILQGEDLIREIEGVYKDRKV